MPRSTLLNINIATPLLALSALLHPVQEARNSGSVQCSVDVVGLDGELRPISDKVIGGGKTEIFAIGAPYLLMIVNSVDQNHTLTISITKNRFAGANIVAFTGDAATNPLLVVNHVGEVGEGIDLVGYTEVQVECQQLL